MAADGLTDTCDGTLIERVGSSDRDHPGPQHKGPTMSDKSPRQSMTKKSGKSLKEKRAEKHAKAARTSQAEALFDRKR